MLSAASTLPWLLFALYAGAVIDRHDRARIVLVGTVIRVGLLVAGAVVAGAGLLTLPVLLGLLVCLGVAEVFVDTASGVLIPDVAPRSRLNAANSRLLGMRQLANAFLGGPLAGIVVGLGAGWLFGIPGALVAIGAVLVWCGLIGKVTPPRAESDALPRPVLAEISEGLRYLFSHRVVRPLLLTGTVINFAFAGYFAVFVVWAVGAGSALEMTEVGYGVLPATLAAGALLGAVAAEWVAGALGEARTIRVAWTTCAVAMLLPVLVPQVWAVAAAFTVAGTSSTVGNVVMAALRQRLVPRTVLGRVSGASRTLALGSTPLGAVLGGAVAEVAGVPVLMAGAAVVSLVAAAVMALRVPRRVIDAADADLDG